MIARLQRALVLSLLLVPIAAAVFSAQGSVFGTVAWSMTALALTGAALLGIEMLLSAVCSRHDPTPRPTWAQWLTAWLGECVTAPQVFGWRQPFRSTATLDQIASRGTAARGMVLVHGYFCNRGLWAPWQSTLKVRGIPCIAVTLEPAFGSIDRYAETIDRAVQQMQQLTGQAPVIVAHSMGGLAVRQWLQQHDALARVHHVVTIGTPHHGTWLARWAHTQNGKQMRQGGDWLLALSARETPATHERFTCFYGHCDNIVFPAVTAILNGADNRHLAAVAHMRMVSRPEVMDEACRRAGALPTANESTPLRT